MQCRENCSRRAVGHAVHFTTSHGLSLGGGDVALRAHDAFGTAAAALEAIQRAVAHGLRPPAVVEDAGMDLSGGPALLLRLRQGLRHDGGPFSAALV